MVYRKKRNRKGKGGRKPVSFTWSEGRYIDLWSIVHIISGSILALLLSFTDLSLLWSITFAVALMIVWEIFESIIKVGESIENLFIDILVGLFGFSYMTAIMPEDGGVRLSLLITFAAFGLILDYFGWKAFKKRTK